MYWLYCVSPWEIGEQEAADHVANPDKNQRSAQKYAIHIRSTKIRKKIKMNDYVHKHVIGPWFAYPDKTQFCALKYAIYVRSTKIRKKQKQLKKHIYKHVILVSAMLTKRNPTFLT